MVGIALCNCIVSAVINCNASYLTCLMDIQEIIFVLPKSGYFIAVISKKMAQKKPSGKAGFFWVLILLLERDAARSCWSLFSTVLGIHTAC